MKLWEKQRKLYQIFQNTYLFQELTEQVDQNVVFFNNEITSLLGQWKTSPQKKGKEVNLLWRICITQI